jgi:predicted SAM-dependent methyltransferase
MVWMIKLGAKLVLARIPAGYGLWQRLGLFRHGAMDSSGYAISVFQRHFERLTAAGLRPGFVGLELGPGDSASSVLLARCFGATKTYLVDSGAFARTDMRIYKELAEECVRRGIDVPDDIDFSSFDAFLKSCRAEYLTGGLRSLQTISTASVDAIWSQAVLEHVRASEFLAMMREFRRVLASGGVASHRVDLKDHLAGALNNLRFSEPLWESSFFASSGFYTNRIRYSKMLSLFQEAGFAPSVLHTDKWRKLPTAQHSMAEPYRSMASDELLINGFDVLLRANQ